MPKPSFSENCPPTRYNVADDATRDVPDNFTREHRWFNGPEFLRDPPELWPAEETQLSTDTGEERVNTVTERREKQYKEVLPDVNRFSNWNRYVRAAARVLQAVQYFKQRVNTVHYKRTKAAASENPDWRHNEAVKSAAKRVVQAPEERFVTLPAELQEEAERIIIKASQEAAFEEELRSLEKGKPVSKESRLRGERRQLLSAAQMVIRLRPTVKAVVRSCFKCRQRAATPPQPITGDLPPCRLAHHHRPFTYTGLDYFGPLTVTVGRKWAGSQKRKELRNTLLAGAEQEASRRAIRWRFIPPGAPFMGGAWERLVRSVKTALTTVLHEQRPHEETLSTLLAEVEFTVNSRPLTHVSVNPEDPEALTPNHFLLGCQGHSPHLIFQPNTATAHMPTFERRSSWPTRSGPAGYESTFPSSATGGSPAARDQSYTSATSCASWTGRSHGTLGCVAASVLRIRDLTA
ncbi:uncharacterized protein LOC119190690 [Manduca sexta]|uniref:uncharacterized protein LOC119190690 n=1 Tax=Manduca sexta TaxID=7130 RepID=UPI00188DE721|nr:uncharacterized protein LOC119190690 [Manduca sexta]